MCENPKAHAHTQTYCYSAPPQFPSTGQRTYNKYSSAWDFGPANKCKNSNGDAEFHSPGLYFILVIDTIISLCFLNK